MKQKETDSLDNVMKKKKQKKKKFAIYFSY